MAPYGGVKAPPPSATAARTAYPFVGMAYAEDSPPSLKPRMSQEATALAYEWRKLTRAATAVAVLTSPAWFLVFWKANHWDWYWAALATFVGVIAFRGAVDVISHKLIPTPNLYGAQSELLEEDIVARRRVWYWRTRFRRLFWLALSLFVLLVGLNLMLKLAGINVGLFDTFDQLGQLFTSFLPTLLILGLQLPLLFFINFAILFGPLLFFGIKQMKAYEPGDADWGVKLDDVRGQQEPKEEVTRVISLWQAGEEFERAVLGGRPGSPSAWREAHRRLTTEVSTYAGTTIREATAEMFKLWWCRTGTPTGVVRRFGELVDQFLPA